MLAAALCCGAFALSACTPPFRCDRVGGAPMLEYQLFFGRSNVSDSDWTNFTAQVITPSLPDGFTTLDAYGQWMNPDTQRISGERTTVLIVAVPDTPTSTVAIARVKDEYRVRFRHIAVGTVIHPVCAAF